MAKAVDVELSAVVRLVHVIEQMAARQSNPVLEVLGEQVHHLQQEKKYPQPPLAFQQGPWRAFYHCHALPDSKLKEHGHFHIFTRHQQQWTHVAALSMDAEGQPQAWVAVNRWVTDGPWLPAAQLIQCLQTADFAIANLSLVEDWLLCMLQVFAPEVATLLAARDRALRQINVKTTEPLLLDDRDVYTLSVHGIDLLTKLSSLNPQA